MFLKARITLISLLTTFVVAAALVSVAGVTDRMAKQRFDDTILAENALIWGQLLADQPHPVAGTIAELENEFDLRSPIYAS